MAIAALLENMGDIRGAVDAYAQHAAGSDENRRQLEASIPAAKTRRTALRAAAMYSALGMPEKAAPLFVQAGERLAAAREMEKAGDFEGLAHSYAVLGRHLDAVRALERSGAKGPDTVVRLQDLLYRHLSELAPADEKAVRALQREAVLMEEQGKLIPALARFRLLQDGQKVRDISLRLGRHEEALRYFLNTDQLDEARRYAASPGIALSLEFVRSFVDARWGKSPPADIENRELVEVVLLMFATSLHGADFTVARPLIEEVFDRIFGVLIDENLLPAAAFDMLIAYRVVNVIMSLWPFHVRSIIPASSRISGLINSLSRAASDTGDPDLAACAAFAAGDIEGFERLASGIELTDANAVLLAASSARCPEAVALLMARGRVGQAEMACRRHGDYARAGRYAEERGDMREAVRWFMDGRDYASALRCALSSGNKRAAARAYEHLGRFDEAIGMLTRLGKVREVERVRKKKQKSPRAG